MNKLYAINGMEIIGTLEVIQGRADIDPCSIKRKDDGKIEFQYGGYTEVFWDEQKTKRTEDGRRIFLDEDGNEWYEDEVIIKEVP